MQTMSMRAPFQQSALQHASSSRVSVLQARVCHTGRPFSLRAPITLIRASKPNSDSDVDECEDNFGDYCAIDSTGKRAPKRSLGEMEQEFLETLSSWYYDGKPTMSDEEFTVLKETLLWSGSKVAVLDSNEQRFLEASMSYARGKPILTDAEFDQLKEELKQRSSVVTAQGPRCSIRSKKMYSDAQPDYLKMTLLNLPSALLVLGLTFAIDDLTGFSLTSAIELPPPYGVALLWGILLPVFYGISSALTNIGFKDFVILKAPCPNCSTENVTYFGDILTVPGNRGQNSVECPNCSAGLTFDENKRVVVVDELPEERQKKKAALAAKKAASAAKKAAAASKKQAVAAEK